MRKRHPRRLGGPLLVAALALLRAGTATADDIRPLPVQDYRLSNGLRVILHEDHSTPRVCVNVWFHVGSKDEPRGRNGFAHLFEHLMFQGSKHVGEDQFFVHLERAGASDRNGTTSLDRTNYYETVPSHQLELALWLESDRAGFLLDHVNQATFESQRDVVKNERRQHYENAPYGLVSKVVQESVFPREHPYHHLTIGSPEDLDAASIEDVRSFYKTFYVPNNASLVVAGDIVPDETRRLVEQYFGPIPRAAAPPVTAAPTPSTLDREVVVQMEAGVSLARVHIAYPSPAFFAPGDAELDGLSLVLADGETSRLHKRLVYDLQWAKEVDAAQWSSQLASSFYIVATATPGHTARELLSVIDEELNRLHASAPSTLEVERAKAKLESHLVFAMEDLGKRADMFNTYAQYTGSPNAFARDVARYRALSPRSIQQASHTYLGRNRRVVVLVDPVEGAPIAGRVREGK